MPAASNYLESGLLNHLFRSNTFSKPATIAVGLTTNVPDDAETGGTVSEVADANAYARVDVGAPADGSWDFVDQVNASGHLQNTSAITFPQATGNWGMVSGVFIADSGIYGSGNVLFHAALSTPRDVQSNDTFQFAAGDLDVYLS